MSLLHSSTAKKSLHTLRKKAIRCSPFLQWFSKQDEQIQTRSLSLIIYKLSKDRLLDKIKKPL